jgi:hypothetical protein
MQVLFGPKAVAKFVRSVDCFNMCFCPANELAHLSFRSGVLLAIADNIDHIGKSAGSKDLVPACLKQKSRLFHWQ